MTRGSDQRIGHIVITVLNTVLNSSHGISTSQYFSRYSNGFFTSSSRILQLPSLDGTTFFNSRRQSWRTSTMEWKFSFHASRNRLLSIRPCFAEYHVQFLMRNFPIVSGGNTNGIHIGNVNTSKSSLFLCTTGVFRRRRFRVPAIWFRSTI